MFCRLDMGKCINVAIVLIIILLTSCLLAACDHFNLPLEGFTQKQTGRILEQGEPEIEGSTFRDGVRYFPPAAEITVNVTIENSQGYDLVVDVWNNKKPLASGLARAADQGPDIWANQEEPSLIVVHIKGAQSGDVFNLTLKILTADKNRIFDDIVIPAIGCAEFSAAEITEFSFPDGGWTNGIDQVNKKISVSIPYEMRLRTDITPNVTVSPGAYYEPADAWGEIVSGKERVYTVTPLKGAPQPYTVTVNVLPNTAAEIKNFSVTGSSAAVAGNTVTRPGSIQGTNISITVPYETDVTNLDTSITISEGAEITPAEKAQDFTNPVTYTVTAANGDKQTYRVTVEAAAIKTLGSINGNKISPNGYVKINPDGSIKNKSDILDEIKNDLTSVMGIDSLGTSITINGDDYLLDYTGEVTPGRNLKVYVNVIKKGNPPVASKDFNAYIKSDAAKLTEFTLFDDWTGIIDDVTGTVDVTVANGTEISSRIPKVVLSPGADYSPKETAWGSGGLSSTEADGTTRYTKRYTVTAQDGITTRNYDVIVSILGEKSVMKKFSSKFEEETIAHGKIPWVDLKKLVLAVPANAFSGASFKWFKDGDSIPLVNVDVGDVTITGAATSKLEISGPWEATTHEIRLRITKLGTEFVDKRFTFEVP
jgi:hypothetical protein